MGLISARLKQDLIREKIKKAETGYMPTLDLTASTSVSNRRNTNQFSDSDNGEHKIGLSFNMLLYNGGATYSVVKQAQYGFIGASAELESAQCSAVKEVRSSFNNISASISSISAYRQAVVSSQSSLHSMEAGYQVGTRTILDVLNVITTLYNAKQQLANAHYDYLINELKIKSALGVLNPDDLIAFNEILDTPIATSSLILTTEEIAPTSNQQDTPTDVAPMSIDTVPKNGGNPFRS